MSDEEGMMQCESCGSYAHGLTTVQDMYDVCNVCLDNHGLGKEDGDK
jgi:hypothetical protein